MPLTPEETARYARQLVLPELGEEGQQKIKRAHVVLVGLGGLGSPVALYLAAAGVGTLTIIDPDEVALSNLQRQILHSTASTGQAKTISAAARIKDLNPAITLIPVQQKLTPSNATELLQQGNLVIDASDNYAARFAMAEAAATLHIPMIYGAVRRFQGQAALFAPHEGTPCYRCLFPEETSHEEEDTASAEGIMGAHAGIIGSIQALESLKKLAGIPSPLQGAMLSVDSLSLRFTLITLQTNPDCTCRQEKPAFPSPHSQPQ